MSGNSRSQSYKTIVIGNINSLFDIPIVLHLPIFVACNCHVVDVLSKIKGGCIGISFVIECPVVGEAVVVEFRVRDVDPILQRSTEVVPRGKCWNGRRGVAVLVPVDAGLEDRLLTLVHS